MVLMADGTSKPIDQVEVGDKITNAQPDSPTTETDTVTAVHVTYTDRDYDQLTIATPAEPCSEPVDRLGEGIPSRVIDSKVTE